MVEIVESRCLRVPGAVDDVAAAGAAVFHKKHVDHNTHLCTHQHTESYSYLLRSLLLQPLQSPGPDVDAKAIAHHHSPGTSYHYSHHAHSLPTPCDTVDSHYCHHCHCHYYQPHLPFLLHLPQRQRQQVRCWRSCRLSQQWSKSRWGSHRSRRCMPSQ